MTLKKLLGDWEESDVAQYWVVCCLGLMNYDASFMNFRQGNIFFGLGIKYQTILKEILEKK